MNGNNYYYSAFKDESLNYQSSILDDLFRSMMREINEDIINLITTEDAEYMEIKPISNGMPEKEIPELEIEEVTDLKKYFSKRQK